jgi:hypothetical protein
MLAVIPKQDVKQWLVAENAGVPSDNFAVPEILGSREASTESGG